MIEWRCMDAPLGRDLEYARRVKRAADWRLHGSDSDETR